MKLLKTAALLVAAAGASVALSTSNNSDIINKNNNNNKNDNNSTQIISDNNISNNINNNNLSLIMNNINRNQNNNNNNSNKKSDEKIRTNNMRKSIQNKSNEIENVLENLVPNTTSTSSTTTTERIQQLSTLNKESDKPMTIENTQKNGHYTTVVNKNSANDTVIEENVMIGMENSDDILRSIYTNQSNEGDIEYPECHPDNPHFNCSRDEFLQYRLGPQRLPFYKVLLVTIVFGAIFITSILGNVLVCIVIVRHSSMHTATNYYLFSLAVSDLLYLIFGLPAEIFLYYHQYPYLFGLPFCKIRAFISEASTYVSVLTIVAFSLERFLAICHPLHLYAMSGFKRAVRLIAALWIISFLSAIPFAFMTGIQYLTYPLDNSIMPESAFCGTIWIPESVPIFELSFCVFFVIPMILIIIVYGRMGAQIRSTTLQQLGVQQCTLHRESRHQQSRKAVIRMLAAVVITFFICWLPFHLQRLYFLYAQDDENYAEINEWIYNIAGFAYYISCSINPILYNVMSHRYRVAFKDILCGKRSPNYFKNGFAREHSSFRETMASSLGGNSTYDRVHSVRVRSTRHLNPKDRDSIKSNNTVWMKRNESHTHHESKEDHLQKGTHMLVVMENAINGRTKCYTESEAQETLINQNNETCI